MPLGRTSNVRLGTAGFRLGLTRCSFYFLRVRLRIDPDPLQQKVIELEMQSGSVNGWA
jgi:hypothetical protein